MTDELEKQEIVKHWMHELERKSADLNNPSANYVQTELRELSVFDFTLPIPITTMAELRAPHGMVSQAPMIDPI